MYPPLYTDRSFIKKNGVCVVMVVHVVSGQVGDSMSFLRDGSKSYSVATQCARQLVDKGREGSKTCKKNSSPPTFQVVMCQFEGGDA